MGQFTNEDNASTHSAQSSYKMAAILTAKPFLGTRCTVTSKTAGRVAMPAKKTTTCGMKFEDIAKGAVTFTTTLAFAAAAHAGEVKLGSDAGALEFVPASLTVKAGEKVTFTNNAGFPHNVVFDEDAIPAGVDADAISHEGLLNAKGETVSNTFSTPGTYEYYCEPHQVAGMAGKIIVQ